MNLPGVTTYLEKRIASDGVPLDVSFSHNATDFPCEVAGRRFGYLKSARESLSESDIEYLKSLSQQLAALCHCPDWNAAVELDELIAKLHASNPLYSWTGVYRKTGASLTITSYRGPYTPHAVIPIGEGICGAAVREAKTLNIPDVKADPRYLSCDFRTKSEIVVPIFHGAEAIAEIDIDSHETNAFHDADQHRLEDLARELSPLMLQLIR